MTKWTARGAIALGLSLVAEQAMNQGRCLFKHLGQGTTPVAMARRNFESEGCVFASKSSSYQSATRGLGPFRGKQ